jgi:hypothetical protein
LSTLEQGIFDRNHIFLHFPLFKKEICDIISKIRVFFNHENMITMEVHYAKTQ